jgi:hypothetical protein
MSYSLSTLENRMTYLMSRLNDIINNGTFSNPSFLGDITFDASSNLIIDNITVPSSIWLYLLKTTSPITNISNVNLNTWTAGSPINLNASQGKWKVDITVSTTFF